MIETRAILSEDMKFHGGFSLDRGTVIYVRETGEGWLGMYYTDKGSGHGFALNPDQFSILQSGDVGIETHIVSPNPPTPPEELEREQEMTRRRIAWKIERHRQEADELERLLRELLGEGDR